MIRDPEPVVLLSRTAYDGLLSTAQSASIDPANLDLLIEAIGELERKRYDYELDEVEHKLMSSDFYNGLVGDDAGYYPLAQEDPRYRDKSIPTRCIWNGKGLSGEMRAVFVVDTAAIPKSLVDSLARKGYLKHYNNISQLSNSPFSFFSRVNFRREAYGSRWSVSQESNRRYTGAWLISGGGDSIAWFPDHTDAIYLADCVNAILTLENNVRRYGGAPDQRFPARLIEGGIFELVWILVHSIYPTERFEEDPPHELQERGRRLLTELRRFYDDASPHRVTR